MMWNSPLNAMNMFYCHWLIKNRLWASGLAEYSQAGKDIEREQAETVRSHVAAARDRYFEILLVSHSNIAIHKLIEMGYFKMKALARNMLKLFAKQYCN